GLDQRRAGQITNDKQAFNVGLKIFVQNRPGQNSRLGLALDQFGQKASELCGFSICAHKHCLKMSNHETVFHRETNFSLHRHDLTCGHYIVKIGFIAALNAFRKSLLFRHKIGIA
ncbi:MAG: hypothetical protein ACRENG_16765, partial [bacterium]